MASGISSKKSSRDLGLVKRVDKNGGVRWYARIVRCDGQGTKKQYVKKADNKTHARQLLKELEDKYSARGKEAIEGSRMTFRRLAKLYSERRLLEAQYHFKDGVQTKVAGLRSLSSLVNYRDVLLKYFGASLLSQITHSDIDQFRIGRLRTPTKRGERSIADVNRTLALLRNMMNFAVQNGWIQQSPFERGGPLISLADEQRRERVLSYEEEELLMKAFDDVRLVCYERAGRPVSARISRGRELIRAIVVTAIDTAMRKGELIKLRWSDVDLNDGIININAVNTKTSRARKVAMTRRVRTELGLLWDRSLKDPDSTVFSITDFKKSFSSACREAGIEGLRFHDLRHTAITRMVALGLPPLEIMKVTGHTQWTTFARYVNPDIASLKRIASALSEPNVASLSFESKKLIPYADALEVGSS